jgi:hypothetical protein
MLDVPLVEPGDAQATDLPELAGRWRTLTVLKRDVFSTVERGLFHGPDGIVEAVLRRIDQVPWWSRPLARHFLKREARALKIVGPLGIAPSLLYLGSAALVRSWINGAALHVANPRGDRAYFRSALAVLRKLHRAGICHNDLAKEQNWLRGPDGHAYLTDFQLSARFGGHGRLFRLGAYEDLRHLLKHKRRYAPEALTASERRVLGRKSWIARAWLVTGKRVYLWFTRGLLGFTDREGAGPRLVSDAPPLIARLKTHPQVRDAVIVPFPERRSGTGLYAFVQAEGVTEQALQEFMAADDHQIKPPEHMQIVEWLPRDDDGAIRAEWLTLIAMNQLDLIEGLTVTASDRVLLGRIVVGRKNLMDRFNTGAAST